MMAVLFLIGKGIEKSNVINELLTKLEGKPNYQMASHYPLVIFDCQFKQELWNLNLECHTQFIQGVYENLRETLSKKYIEYLHFYSMGAALLKVPVPDNKNKIDEKKSLIFQKSGDTVEGTIQNLKGKRIEKYDIKIQKVKEYQERCLQKNQFENQ
ncbi:unnamed protein product [Paramecium sonneborni]|uniref:Pseudouridine synthase I TruA alpha/beta domain-containing protein n=1 Tax=Paramecium sonneborni TaxID=65129 RepID=A0A8S1L3A6_9CILI|nr:unnamed protein product [Paramecium sonneborni]